MKIIQIGADGAGGALRREADCKLVRPAPGVEAVIAFDARRRQDHAIEIAGRLQAQPVEDALLDDLPERPVRNPGDDRAQQQRVGVGIVVFATRLELGRVRDAVADQFGPRPVLREILDELLEKCRIVRIVEHAARHACQLPQCDQITLGHTLVVSADRVVELDPALLRRGQG